MNWVWALLIVMVGNVALFAGLVLLVRVVNVWSRRR